MLISEVISQVSTGNGKSITNNIFFPFIDLKKILYTLISNRSTAEN